MVWDSSVMSFSALVKCSCRRVRDSFVAGSPAAWGVLCILAFCCCFLLGGHSIRHLALSFPMHEACAGIIVDHTRKKARGTYQRIREKNGVVSAEFGFKNYNDDSFNVRFSISAEELADYRSSYGFLPSELENLLQWQRNALKAAYQSSLQEDSPTPQQLNKLYEDIKASYLAKYRMLLISRGFTIRPDNVATVDIPAVVSRNVAQLRPLAAELESRGGSLGYGSDSIVSAALSLVQTAIRYEDVPMEMNGRRIGGLYPPVDAVFRGKGDCDSKSALLASILLNWDKVRLIGLSSPSHYLIGILRNPVRGEAFVEYKGMRYVLLETAGPAWLPPGTVGPDTEALIKAGVGMRFEVLGN